MRLENECREEGKCRGGTNVSMRKRNREKERGNNVPGDLLRHCESITGRNGGVIMYRATYCAHTSPLPLLPSGPGGVGGITSRRTRHTSHSSIPIPTSKPHHLDPDTLANHATCPTNSPHSLPHRPRSRRPRPRLPRRQNRHREHD